MLGRCPGTEGAAIITAEGKHCGINPHAVTVRCGVYGDVDGGMVGVGEDGALIDGEVGVGVAQHQRWDAAAFEFLAQASGKRDGDVFFQQRIAESLSVIVAAVAGVDDCEIAARRPGAPPQVEWSRRQAGD